MTVRDTDVEYSFDDPDEGWFGMARPVDTAPARHAEETTGQDHSVAAEPFYDDDPPAYDPQPGQPHLEPDVRSEEPDHRQPEFDYRQPVFETNEFEENADTDRWYVQDMTAAAPVEPELEPEPEEPPGDERPVVESVAASLIIAPARRGSATAVAATWESRLSNSGAWDFKAKSGAAWYRSKAVLLVAAALAIGAAVVGIVLLLIGPGSAEAPTVAPSAPSAPPTPATSVPALSSQAPLPPPPPPGPPPPPPPSAEELNPPVVTRQYSPRYQTPDEPKKPQTNVTRSPLSATPPPPPQQTDKGRATPGESGHHGFFG